MGAFKDEGDWSDHKVTEALGYLSLAGVSLGLASYVSYKIYRFYASKPNNLPPGTFGYPFVGNNIVKLPWKDKYKQDAYVNLSQPFYLHMRKTYGNVYYTYRFHEPCIVFSGGDAIHDFYELERAGDLEIALPYWWKDSLFTLHKDHVYNTPLADDRHTRLREIIEGALSHKALKLKFETALTSVRECVSAWIQMSSGVACKPYDSVLPELTPEAELEPDLNLAQMEKVQSVPVKPVHHPVDVHTACNEFNAHSILWVMIGALAPGHLGKFLEITKSIPTLYSLDPSPELIRKGHAMNKEMYDFVKTRLIDIEAGRARSSLFDFALLLKLANYERAEDEINSALSDLILNPGSKEVATARDQASPASVEINESVCQKMTNHMIDIWVHSLPISSLMTSLVYFAGTYREILEKVRAELNERFPRKQRLDYDGLNSLPFLDAVVKEVKRMAGPIPEVFRRFTKAVRDEKRGFTYPKDWLAIHPFHDLCYDPSIWEDPDVFKPERFMTDNPSASKAAAAVLANSRLSNAAHGIPDRHHDTTESVDHTSPLGMSSEASLGTRTKSGGSGKNSMQNATIGGKKNVGLNFASSGSNLLAKSDPTFSPVVTGQHTGLTVKTAQSISEMIRADLSSGASSPQVTSRMAAESLQKSFTPACPLAASHVNSFKAEVYGHGQRRCPVPEPMEMTMKMLLAVLARECEYIEIVSSAYVPLPFARFDCTAIFHKRETPSTSSTSNWGYIT